MNAQSSRPHITMSEQIVRQNKRRRETDQTKYTTDRYNCWNRTDSSVVYLLTLSGDGNNNNKLWTKRNARRLQSVCILRYQRAFGLLMLSVQVLTRKQSASSIQQTSQHQLVVVSSVDDLTRAHHVSHDKTAKVFLFIISFGFVVVVVVLVSIIVSFIVSLCVCASVCVSRCSASSGFNEFQFILHRASRRRFWRVAVDFNCNSFTNLDCHWTNLSENMHCI